MISKNLKLNSLIFSKRRNVRLYSIGEKVETFWNELGIPMIDESLRLKLFGIKCPKDDKEIDRALSHLKRHDQIDENFQKEPKICLNRTRPENFQIPNLNGENISLHFEEIAKSQINEYFQLASDFINIQIVKPPERFNFSPGWTRYFDLIENYQKCTEL